MITDYATIDRRAFCATPSADQVAIANERHARRMAIEIEHALERYCDGLSLDDPDDRAKLARWISWMILANR